MPVWRALRIDRAALLVERSVVIDVRLVRVQIRNIRCDLSPLGVVPGSASDPVASVDVGHRGAEVRTPRATALAGLRGERLAVFVCPANPPRLPPVPEPLLLTKKLIDWPWAVYRATPHAQRDHEKRQTFRIVLPPLKAPS